MPPHNRQQGEPWSSHGRRAQPLLWQVWLSFRQQAFACQPCGQRAQLQVWILHKASRFRRGSAGTTINILSHDSLISLYDWYIYDLCSFISRFTKRLTTPPATCVKTNSHGWKTHTLAISQRTGTYFEFIVRHWWNYLMRLYCSVGPRSDRVIVQNMYFPGHTSYFI